MRSLRLPSSALICLVSLVACSDDGTQTTTPTSETTGDGDGDGDPGDGDPGDGDPGDGDPGDGDGDPGDGDPGDGDPGDGDGDPCPAGMQDCPCADDMCDDGLNCVEGTCVPPTCGDGIVDPGEECDVGGETMFCDGDCTYAVCGDGYHNMLAEECDDGNNENTDGCVGPCWVASCGDDYVYEGVEECDDGDMDNNNDCKNDCSNSVCGDGIVWNNGNGEEECDDGNMDGTDACNDQCLDSFCGDGVVWQGMETCDDGNMDNTDACAQCEPAVCGDGFLYIGMEECDDGNNDPNDFCDNCTLTGAEVTCNDILTNMNMWGQVAAGVDLRLFTNSTLHWIGCPGNGCPANTFYCDYDANAHTLQFGTTSNSAMRSVVDPGNMQGDMMPQNNAGCCQAALQLCNAPDSNNNNVNVDMVAALCASLGYGQGTIIREVFNNVCAEPHALAPNGLDWSSDWVNSSGHGAEYLCNN